MRILVVGASGLLGRAATQELEARHEVLKASRNGQVTVDLSDTGSIRRMYESIGKVDAVISSMGSVPFKNIADLHKEDFALGLADKVLGQIDLVLQGLHHVNEGGSFTVTTGILAREPIAAGAVASTANGALESFVMAAAPELPRGLRINAVSPTVLEEAEGYHSAFPGFDRVAAKDVGRAYGKSVEGIQTGRIFNV